ncbi:hypothetical protein G5I_08682 [Acromyrmex echinatior]|uniref:Uncharacterized protein n=1 Tax=Acromyrmex echinatior TaxID=103372 RepID=F4WS70_ACREC|nr:hypothetical protein G5I_08682 [Acromyrmex echinatior]
MIRAERQWNQEEQLDIWEESDFFLAELFGLRPYEPDPEPEDWNFLRFFLCSCSSTLSLNKLPTASYVFSNSSLGGSIPLPLTISARTPLSSRTQAAASGGIVSQEARSPGPLSLLLLSSLLLKESPRLLLLSASPCRA